MTERFGRRVFARAGAALGAALMLGCNERVPAGRQGLSLWFTYGGKNREVLERLVARFNHIQTRFFVRAIYQGDYFEGLAKLRTAIAARSAPGFSHVIGEVVPYLYEAGVLEHLSGYSGAAELDVIPELGQEKSWVGGAQRPLVALPFNRSTPIAYLNRQIFESARISPPTTWSELRETASKLTVRSGSHTTRHGFGCPIDWWFWVALVGQAGGQVVERDGTVSLGGEAGIRALELWQALVTEDRSMKPPPGRDYNAWEQTNQDFIASRTAMIWTSTAFLKYLEQNAPFPIVAAALPAGVRRAVPTGGTHWVVPRDAAAADKVAAWAFLKFMHEPEQVIEWATATGYLPTTRSAVRRLEQRGYYRAHPNDRVALEQLDVALPWPWSPDLFRIQREVVQPRLESAVLERRDASAVLAEARELAAQSRP